MYLYIYIYIYIFNTSIDLGVHMSVVDSLLISRAHFDLLYYSGH